MKIKLLFVMFAMLALTAFSVAQDGAKSALEGSMVDAVGLPGQGWTSLGNLSPIEHNNFYTQSYFEQSAGFLHLFGFDFNHALRRRGTGPRHQRL